MATINFKMIFEETEKAVKLLVREQSFDVENCKMINEVSFWVPKSVVTIEGNTATIQDWFYNKNIAVDTYSAFMKAMSNN